MKSIQHQTNLFCWQRGIKAKDLESHPCADDLVLLIRLKEEFWEDITKSNKQSLDCFWHWVYNQKQPLRHKHLTKLQHIAINGTNTRHHKNIKLRQARMKIKQLKQAKTQNPTT